MSLDVAIQIPGVTDPWIIKSAEPGGAADSPPLNVINLGIARGALVTIDYWKRIDRQTAEVEADARTLGDLTKLHGDMDTWFDDNWVPPLWPALVFDPRMTSLVKVGATDNITADF